MLSDFETALSSGNPPPSELTPVFLEEAERLSRSRALARQLVTGAASPNVFATMKLLATVPRL